MVQPTKHFNQLLPEKHPDDKKTIPADERKKNSVRREPIKKGSSLVWPYFFLIIISRQKTRKNLGTK